MADSIDRDSSDLPRIAAQRNAAFAAALVLTGVVICAGWALEQFPRRNAEIYRLQNAALLSGDEALKHDLIGTQAALLQTQAALRETQAALRNTQEALRLAEQRTAR
jgi:hypothetical protein